jgi:hypothetical protein
LLQVLVNFGFLLALLCGHIAQRIFFGPLRAPEIEVRRRLSTHNYNVIFFVPKRLYDRLWFFVTESLLAFTIFRDEFDIPFVLMFTFLLFIKSFHWLAADRIEWVGSFDTSTCRFSLSGRFRWINGPIPDRHPFFTLECPLYSRSYGPRTVYCF